jgi:hypothetical protein
VWSSKAASVNGANVHTPTEARRDGSGASGAMGEPPSRN